MGTMRISAPKKAIVANVYDDEELAKLKEQFIEHVKNKKLNNSIQIIDRILTILPGLRSKANVARNMIVSIREGLMDSSITKEEATSELIKARKSFLDSLSTFIQELTSDGKLTKKSTQPKGVRTPEPEQDPDAPTGDESGNIKLMVQETLEDFLNKIQDNVSPDNVVNFNGSKASLQKMIVQNSVVMTRAPIVPMTKTPFSVQKLKAFGFRVQDLEGYPILEDQLVLGIMHAGINDDVQDIVDKKMAKTKSKGMDDKTRVEKAHKMLDQEMERISKELDENLLESVKHEYANLKLIEFGPSYWAGAAWYWLVPNSHLNLFNKSSIAKVSQMTQVKSWSFPFK